MQADDAMLGRVLGGCRIVSILGKGGMAVVYKAYQESVGRFVAIKVLSPALANDPRFVERFRREALAVARLRHPNIIQVFDAGREGGHHYIIMELVEGGTLGDRMRQGLLSPALAAAILSPVADALDHAHRAGIIHRDIKPSNILFTKEGQPVLSDFGIARALQTSQLTTTGVFIGTPEYVSPESVEGQSLDARSDVYSLGVVLYQMLTGRVPFSARTPTAVLYGHVYKTPPSPRSLNPGINLALEQAVLTALAKNPRDRYSSAGELARHVQTEVESPPDAHRAVLQPARNMRTPALLGPLRRNLAEEISRAPIWAQVLVGGLMLVSLVALAWGLADLGRAAGTPVQVAPTPHPTTPTAATLTAMPVQTVPLPVQPTLRAAAAVGTPERASPTTVLRVTSALMPTVTLVPPKPTPVAPTPPYTPTLTPRRPTPTLVPVPLPGSGRGRIAFVSERDSGDAEIYIMNADGSGEKRLTASAGHDWSPAFSPDGTRIAYASSRDAVTQDVHNIYSMDVSGKNVVRLTFNRAWDDFPSWSPDGRRLAFVSTADNNAEIFVMNSDGTDVRRLTYVARDDVEPAWSPDGQRLALSSDRSGTHQIYIMSVGSQAYTQVTRAGANRHPAWSPDGTRLAFYSDRDGNSEIYVVDLASGSEKRLTHNPAQDEHPTWSPYEDAIAFWSNRGGSTNDVYVMWADGTGVTRLTSSTASDGAPTWGR